MRTFRVDTGGRLDAAVVRQLEGIPGITRARVRGWVEEGRVRLNGRAVAKPSRRLAPGDEVEVDLPPAPPRPELAPLEMPLSIVHEDEWLLVLDKPPGLVVHPASGNREGTLMHALLWRAQGWGGGRRPHLVSRLDQGTSGLILVAKTPEVHAALQKRRMEKDYLAVVYGRPALPKGRIDLGILRDPEDPGGGLPRAPRVGRAPRSGSGWPSRRSRSRSCGAGCSPAGPTRSGSTSRPRGCRSWAIRSTALRAGRGSAIPSWPGSAATSRGRPSTPGGWGWPIRSRGPRWRSGRRCLRTWPDCSSRRVSRFERVVTLYQRASLHPVSHGARSGRVSASAEAHVALSFRSRALPGEPISNVVFLEGETWPRASSLWEVDRPAG